MKKVIIVIVVLVVVSLIVKNILDANRLDEKGRYVVGNIVNIRAASGGMRIFVSYNFKGKDFHGDFVSPNWRENNPRIGRSFIKIDSVREDNIEILYKVIVPDSIKVSPAEGWKDLPVH